MKRRVVTFKGVTNAEIHENEYIFKPVSETARYLTLLAGREKLSSRELYIIEKIGFIVKIITEP
jgi:hypothetical protein